MLSPYVLEAARPTSGTSSRTATIAYTPERRRPPKPAKSLGYNFASVLLLSKHTNTVIEHCFSS
eukprot:scaffold145662_cov26-Prasinocladus_malaysianus.AAC.1